MAGVFLSMGGGDTIILTNQAITTTNPAGAEAGYQLTSAGLANRDNDGVFTLLETWDSNSSSTASYEVQVTVAGHALTSGTTGTWLNLGTTRLWYIAAPSGNTWNSTLTVQIRNASTLTVVASATITLTADAV